MNFGPIPLFGAVLAALGSMKTASAEHSYSDAHAKFQRALQSRLSPNATILIPISDGFDIVTKRWSSFAAPNIITVVQVANTHDVANAVKLANQYGLPFLATNHRHGVTTVMEKLQGGVQIDVSGLQTMQLDGQSNAVTLGGGVYTEEVINYMYEHGRMSGTSTP